MSGQFDLSGQRIAIAGAGGGIGAATANLVADMDADVLVSDLTAPDAVAAVMARKRQRDNDGRLIIGIRTPRRTSCARTVSAPRASAGRASVF